MNHSNWASIRHCISLDEVINHQDNQVCHRHQSRNTGVLQRVQSAQVGKGYHNQPGKSHCGQHFGRSSPRKINAHKNSHPELTVHEKVIDRVTSHKALNHARHEVADNDKIAHTDTETFDRDRGIKDYSRIGVCQL